MIAATNRNKEIIAFIEANDWSYQLVADKFGVTRNIVAGIMFRHHRKPGERRGLGRRGCPYVPAYTARKWMVQ